MARAPPLKQVYIGAKGAFRKFLGSVTKYGYLKIVQRGDPLGRQAFESLRGGGVRPPPKSAPGIAHAEANDRKKNWD